MTILGASFTMYVSFGLMIAGRPSIVSSVPRRIFRSGLIERSSLSSITAASQRGSMNSKSICDARTKRVAWGGTRDQPGLKGLLDLRTPILLQPQGAVFRLLHVQKHHRVGRTRNLIDQVLKLVVGEAGRPEMASAASMHTGSVRPPENSAAIPICRLTGLDLSR